MSIDAIENQRGEESIFSEDFGGLEKELSGRLLFSLRLTFDYKYRGDMEE